MINRDFHNSSNMVIGRRQVQLKRRSGQHFFASSWISFIRSLVILVVWTIPDFGSPEVEMKFLKNSEKFPSHTTFAREMLERLNLVKKAKWFCSGKIWTGGPPRVPYYKSKVAKNRWTFSYRTYIRFIFPYTVQYDRTKVAKIQGTQPYRNYIRSIFQYTVPYYRTEVAEILWTQP